MEVTAKLISIGNASEGTSAKGPWRMAQAIFETQEQYSKTIAVDFFNTYIQAGDDSNEDIIASVEYGLYAKDMGGGSVNPATGGFNFAVQEGYIIRNGKICEPVRGASLVGTGSEIIMKIDMVGQDLALGQGMCGSSSGSVPVNVGQPMIRVSSITVGGR